MMCMNILFLLAVTWGLVSPRGVTSRNPSDNTTCLVEIDDTDVLQELLGGEAVFINIDLSFGDYSEMIVEDNTTVIDINRWVVVIGKTGELLSTFPFDFVYLSLGTLNPGVKHISLNITSLPDCFTNADEDEKLNIIATSFLQVENMKDTESNEDGQSDEDVKRDVCIERQLTRDNFSVSGVYGVPSCYYTILQGSTYFDCWRISEDSYSVEYSNFVTHFWLNVFFWFSIIFSLYFNLFFVSFFCRTKPMVNDGKQYLSIRTDLPMGPKYWLFFGGNEYKICFIMRWLVILTSVCLLQYVPYLIANCTDSKNFERRWEAIFNNGLIRESTFVGWNIYVNLVYFIFGLILITICIKYQNWFETSYIETTMRDHFILTDFDLAPDLKIPKDNYSGLNRFLFVLKLRTKMAVSISHWWHGLKGFWNSLPFESHQAIRFILATILVGPFLALYAIATILNSVPLFYCMLRFFQLWAIDDNMKPRQQILMILASLGLLLVEIALIGKFVSIFAYISGIICYFCIGLLVNSGTAGPYVAVAIIVFGYLVSTITDYYHGYVVLLNQVISVVDDLIKDNKIHVSEARILPFPICNNNLNDDRCIALSTVVNFGPGEAGASHATNGNATNGTAATNGTSATNSTTATNNNSAVPATGGAAVTNSSSPPSVVTSGTAWQDTEGLTVIEKVLFDLVVQKYRPPGIQILNIAIRLATLCLVIWVGFSTLKLIEDFTELKDQVELFAAVVIAGIVPLFGKLMHNEAEDESKQKIRENCLQRDIKDYYTYGKFETMAL